MAAILKDVGSWRVLVAWILCVMMFKQSSASGGNTSCYECYRETFCNLTTSAVFYEAKDIGIITYTQFWFNSSFPSDKQSLQPPCQRNRLRKLLAFMFNKTKPTDLPGCSSAQFCETQQCSSKLWQNVTSLSSHERIGSLRMGLLSQLFKTILKAESGATFQRNEMVGVIENSEPNIPPMPRPGCSKQRYFSIIERAELLMYVAKNIQYCGSKRPSFSKNMCGEFVDQLYYAKAKMISDTGRDIYNCKTCWDYLVPTPNLPGCNEHARLFAAENYYGISRSLKFVFGEAFDCRFIDGRCEFVSEDSIATVFFKTKGHLGCMRCIDPEFCTNPKSFQCQSMIMPSQKRLLHATEYVGAETMDCGFDFQHNVRGDIEKAINSIIKFHSIVYVVSDALVTGRVTMPNCSTDCKRIYGPSVACDICGAIDIATIISNLTVSILKCGTTFNFLGHTLCTPTSLFVFKAQCLVTYTSKIEYSTVAKELIALSYAIAAVSGCGNTGVGNDFLQLDMKCAYLRAALKKGSARMPRIIYPAWVNESQAFNPGQTARTAMQNLFSVWRCHFECPHWQRYCSTSESCQPFYLNCRILKSLPRDQLYPVLGSVDISSLPLSSFFLSASINASVVLSNPPNATNSGDWVAYLSNGDSFNLTSLSMGVVVDRGTYVKFKSSRDNAYGIRTLNYLIVSDFLAGHDKSLVFKAGEMFNFKSFNVSLKTAILIIKPIARFQQLKAKSQLPVITMQEDNKMDVKGHGNRVSDFVDLKTATEDHTIPESMYPYIPREELDLYYQYKMTYSRRRPSANIFSMSNNGVWRGKVAGEQLFGESYILALRNKFPVFGSDLYFFPRVDFNGNETLGLKICYCDMMHPEDISLFVNITINVFAVNDRPVPLHRLVVLPPIAFDMTVKPNNGFPVSSMGKDAKDAEEGSLGIAILSLSYSRLGKWYYKLSSSSWVEYVFNSRRKHGLKHGNVDILHLKPEDSLKFVLQNDTSQWTNSFALKQAWLYFAFWDMTDGKTSGVKLMSFGDYRNSSSYSKEAYAIQLREGCDGVPGSAARMDLCGVCGGNGKSCMGCDGKINSGAKYDSCGICSGGTTGRTPNSQKDCAGTCNKAELDDCNVCQKKGSRGMFKDCMGVCFGKAKLNRCKRCYGGAGSSLTETAGMDICGVCNGNGTSCLGCDGVANSGKIKDLCGGCLLPSDALFNSNCRVIDKMNPKTSPVTGGRSVEITGAGFTQFSVAKCYFEKGRTTVRAQDVRIGTNDKSIFTIVTPATPKGTYSLKCTFDNLNTVFQPTSHDFIFYEPASVRVSNVHPSRFSKNVEVNVTFTGTGLDQTDEMHCALMCTTRMDCQKRLSIIKAVIITATQLTCTLPKFPKSMRFRITAVASVEDGRLSELQRLPNSSWFEIEVFAARPRPISANFTKGFKEIVIVFDQNIKLEVWSCTQIFDTNTLKIMGQPSRCSEKGLNTLVVPLGLDATVSPGATLLINGATVLSRGEAIHDKLYTPVVLQGAAQSDPLTVHLTGPTSIGSCDTVQIKASAYGSTGRQRLNFVWRVAFSANTDRALLNAADNADLSATNAYLTSLPSHTQKIVLDSNRLKTSSNYKRISYEFTVKATNFLSQASNDATLLVERTSRNVPLVKILGGSNRKTSSFRNMIISGYVRHSSCQSPTKLISYQWEVSSKQIQLDPKLSITPRLFVPRGTLKSGETYTFTLTAMLADDPSSFSRASVDVEVRSSPLRVKVKEGLKRILGSDSDIVLDASKSFDPDGDTIEVESFSWECYDGKLHPCFIRSPSNTNMARLTFPAAKRVNVSSGTLQSNASYTFLFTYKKGARSASKEVKIKIMPGAPPLVRIRPQRHSKANADKKLVVRGYVQSRSSSGVEVWWECLEEEGYNYLNLTGPGVARSSIRRTIKRRGISWSSIVINKHILTAGASYKLRLNAKNVDGNGYAENVIVVNAPPTQGSFTTDISQGTELDTEFTLQAIRGWEDDDEDLPLKYKFGYIKGNGEDAVLGSASEENELKTFLPAGALNKTFSLKVFVDVSDNRGASTRAVHDVLVRPLTQLNMTKVESIAIDIGSSFFAKDLSSVIGKVSSTVSVLNAVSHSAFGTAGSASPMNLSTGMLDTIIKLKENMTRGVLTMLPTVLDTETQDMVINLMSDLTQGGGRFNDLLKARIALSIATLIKGQSQQANSSSPSSSFMTMPNALTTPDMLEETANAGKEPREIAKIIETYQHIINTSAVDNSSMRIKKEYTGLIKSLMASMCQKSAYGENAAVAKNQLSILQSLKYDFADGGNSNISIDCENCENNGRPAAVINLGNDLAKRYNSWSCTSEYTCNGACIGSAQFPKDLFSDEKQKEINKIVSDVIQVKLFNPETKKMMEAPLLTSPMMLKVPINNFEYSSHHASECRYWDDLALTWKKDGCTAERDLKTVGKKSYVVCHCTRMGTVAAFRGPPYASLTTTRPSTKVVGSSGNKTRNDPLLPLYIIIGMLGLSTFFGAGIFGYDRRKTRIQLTPHDGGSTN